MRRLLEGERRKAAAARERKDGKKSRKQERKVAEQEAESARRADHWRDTLAEDSRTVDLISRLIATKVLLAKAASPRIRRRLSSPGRAAISSPTRRGRLTSSSSADCRLVASAWLAWNVPTLTSTS
mmetsp:Transcript_4057/g.9311  ORF Transcript_4057/g.9311 Transcript_4057/m.9311 type:complete len:126 (+) Transcript_4057:449-826(+)